MSPQEFADQAAVAGRSTVIVVLYRTPTLSLSWVPDSAPVVCVHNDEQTDAVEGPTSITHLRGRGNVGFGSAVNRAAQSANTERLIMVNPDVGLTAEHFQLLNDARPDEIVTVPLSDSSGVPTSVINRYPTALVLLLTGLKVGRIFRRGSRIRAASRHLGGWFADHDDQTASAFSSGTSAQYWASGAVLSVDRERFLSVGGFDKDYFLYFEDVDLQQRLSEKFRDMVLRQVGPPGHHAVSGSTDATNSVEVDIRHCRAAITYARHQRRLTFELAAGVLWMRLQWLRFQAGRR